MPKFISEYFNLGNKLENAGAFDSFIDEDSNFFINLIRLKNTKVPEFKNSYKKINDFFTNIATLLDCSNEKGDKFYNAALKKFNFSEVNEINFGFSKSRHGTGFGAKLRRQVISDAFDIVKKGSKQPEVFHLIGLFEENIGPDRLSDMVATIVYSDIVAYTKRINKELNITQEKYPDLNFKNELVVNPYKKKCNILIVPIDILQELPIAKDWNDIDRVVKENESIRQEINESVSKEWYKWASWKKKRYLKELIFKNPEKCARIITGYRCSTIPKIDFSSDLNYYVPFVFRQMKNIILFSVKDSVSKNSLQAAVDIINIFKDWVENNRGWSIIQDIKSSKRENFVHRLIHLAAKHYIVSNNIDISFESNAGRGHSDFKVSRGNDITIGEIKLSSNSKYLHGYTTQIEEYATSENTKQKIFVFIDIGNYDRLITITEIHQERIVYCEDTPLLFIIDSTPKKPASIY